MLQHPVIQLFKAIFAQWSEDKVTRLAAALAYYTVFSLAPLVMIVMALVGFVLGQRTASHYLVEQAQLMMGQAGAQMVEQIIENASRPGATLTASLIGFGTLIFGATGVFAQLQGALNTIWHISPEEASQGLLAFVKTRLLSFGMLLNFGILLLLSLILSTALATIGKFLPYNLVTGRIVDLLVSLTILFLLFGMIYKVLPDTEITWGDVWMGALLTALLFMIGKSLLSWYLGTQSFGSIYGAAGSILLILLWVYYSAQILLFGAEFTYIYAYKFGSRRPGRDDSTPAAAPPQESAPALEPAPAAPASYDGYSVGLLLLFILGLVIRAIWRPSRQ